MLIEERHDIATNDIIESFSNNSAAEKGTTTIELQPELEGKDICFGADPFIFHKDGKWQLFLQEDLRADHYAHDGIKGCTVRTADTIEGLISAPPVPIIIPEQSPNLHQSWAPEVHAEGDNLYMYIAHSNGENANHRMYAYEAFKDLQGPWKELGKVKGPEKDDSWAIDMTIAEIPYNGKNEKYAIWSGWEHPGDEFPQNLYISRQISPTEIGERHFLAKADQEWLTSVKPLIEGPQALSLDGQFRGVLVSGNASWTPDYATGILKYDGGDPLNTSSWIMGEEPLFPDHKGNGHGMIVEDGDDLVFVGHRKTSTEPGWTDRKVFFTPIDKQSLESKLDSIKRK